MLRGRSSVELADDLPLAVKVNFATALVAAGERSGGEHVLDEIGNEIEPGVQRLRTAIRRWESRLTFLQRFLLRLGFEPNVPLELIPPLGELLDPAVFGIPVGRSPLPKSLQSTYSFDDYIKIGSIHRPAREFEAAEAAYRRALSLDDLQLGANTRGRSGIARRVRAKPTKSTKVDRDASVCTPSQHSST